MRLYGLNVNRKIPELFLRMHLIVRSQLKTWFSSGVSILLLILSYFLSWAAATQGLAQAHTIFVDESSLRIDIDPRRYLRLPIKGDFEKSDLRGIARGDYDHLLTQQQTLPNDIPNERRWYQLVIVNQTDEVRPFVLANALTISSVYFLEKNFPDIVHLAGNYHIQDQNPFSVSPAAKLTLKPGPNEIYIGSHVRGNINFFMMSLWTPEAFESYEKERLIFLSVSFGAFIVIWVYNLVLYILMRQKVYFYYILFCSGLILIEGILGGAFLAFGPEYYKNIQTYWPAAITLSLVGFALFASEFTDATLLAGPFWFKLINITLTATILSTIGYYLGIPIFAKILLIFTLLVIVVLTLSVYRVLIHSVETYYLLVSCIPLVVSSIMLILQITLVMDFNYRIIWFQLGSALLHVILVSTALGTRANSDTLEKVRLQSSIDLGRMVQEWLLPRRMKDRLESFEYSFCYVPREGSLSGDWINHWVTHDGAFHFVLGSVQGEKAQAALAVASIATVIERARDLNLHMAECLKDINDTLLHLFSGRIVTTANGLTVYKDQQMDFLSFGMNGWQIMRQGQLDVNLESLEILGKNSDISFKALRTSLDQMVTAYVLSDGFSADGAKMVYFREQLSRQASQAHSSDELCTIALELSSLQKKNLTGPHHDDRSMLVVSSLNNLKIGAPKVAG